MGLYMYDTLMSHKCVVHIHKGLCMCDTYACVHLIHTHSRYVICTYVHGSIKCVIHIHMWAYACDTYTCMDLYMCDMHAHVVLYI